MNTLCFSAADPNDIYGEFAEAVKNVELQYGEGLPGRCFLDKDQAHHMKNLQDDKDDPRRTKAIEFRITGAFAIFRDGAVWEFCQESPMDNVPTELVQSFGGSTGLDVAATSVMAAVKFKRKGFKKKNAEGTAATHDENGRKVDSPDPKRPN